MALKRNGQAWSCVCPWHRRNDRTGCVSTYQLPGDASLEDHTSLLRRLMWWACQARTFTRQWQHIEFRPDEDSCPEVEFLIAHAPRNVPAERAVPDDQLSNVAGEPPQGRGRGGRGGRGGRSVRGAASQAASSRARSRTRSPPARGRGRGGSNAVARNEHEASIAWVSSSSSTSDSRPSSDTSSSSSSSE